MMIGQGRWAAAYWNLYDPQAELIYYGVSFGAYFIGVAVYDDGR